MIQTFEGGQLARQDEDTNFDGTIDRSFAGGKAAPPPANPKISSEPFAAPRLRPLQRLLDDEPLGRAGSARKRSAQRGEAERRRAGGLRPPLPR